MKKRNSRKIMVETVAKVTAVAIMIAFVAGIGFVVHSWDKFFPTPGQGQSFATSDNPQNTENQSNAFQNIVSNESYNSKIDEKPDDSPADLTQSGEQAAQEAPTVPTQNEEPDETQGTSDEESAYNKSIAQDIVSAATEQLGTPFKSGGSSPEEGFDSTGFTYYCVNKAGVKFPRNIKDQLESGLWVTYEELKAGDIVYFSQDVGGNAAFCGVYVGGGLIIYSPVPDDFVKTANITTNYWTTHFVTGLRVTSQTNG